MKKLIIIFSQFLLITVFIYCIVIIGLYRTNFAMLKMNIPKKEQRRYGFTARKLEEIKTVKSVDILVLGSSLGFRNYNPVSFKNNGYSSFGLGTSSQKPNMTYIIAQKYLKDVKSKLVIVDVNPYLMLTPDTFETTDVIINSKKNQHDWSLFKTAPSMMAINALIIKYSGFAESDRLEKLKDSVSDKKDKYLGNGFVSSGLVYDKDNKTPEINITDFEPLQNQKESLDLLIDFLKSNRINYILVLSPINRDFFQNKSKIKAEQFKNLSKTYFSKYGNYIDSNDLTKYDQADFMDFSHLNETGSEKFTASLVPIIKSHIKK